MGIWGRGEGGKERRARSARGLRSNIPLLHPFDHLCSCSLLAVPLHQPLGVFSSCSRLADVYIVQSPLVSHELLLPIHAITHSNHHIKLPISTDYTCLPETDSTLASTIYTLGEIVSTSYTSVLNLKLDAWAPPARWRRECSMPQWSPLAIGSRLCCRA